jgi:endoglucanase
MTSPLPIAPSGGGGYLLPAGYLSTQGSQIVDAAGTPVRMASIGWNQGFDTIPASVAAMKAAGFNTIRVSWVNATLSSDLQRIDQIVAAAQANGLKVILDNHTNEPGSGPQDNYGAQQKNGLWYDVGGASDGTDGGGNQGHTTDAQFLKDWVTVAQHYAGNSTVAGFDLRNEPLEYGDSTWGDGNLNTDIRLMYQRVGNAIQAVNPGPLIIAEGPQNYSANLAGTGPAPWGDLSLAGSKPVTLNVSNKVVYSVHDYPQEISGWAQDSGAAKVAAMNADWGYLVTQNIAPVWIGEMGSSMQGSTDAAWSQTLVDYMNGKYAAQGGPSVTGNQQGVSGDWWAWGNLPGQYPDGTLNADGSLKADQAAVYSQIRYKPSSVPTTPPPTPQSPSADNTVITGPGKTIVGAQSNVWTITAGGQVAVNGTTDTTTSNVIELAYEKGLVWQESASKVWWSKTLPTDTWGPAAGTTISPVPVVVVPPKIVQSPDNTVILPGSTAAITDAAGNKWTINAAGQVAVNGTADTTTSGVAALAYEKGLIWQENKSNLWWSKTLPTDAWGPAAGTATSPVPVVVVVPPKPVPSPDNTVIPAGSTAAITDAAGNKWTITAAGQVAVNGVADATTSGVAALAYEKGLIWQENKSNLWWSKTLPTDAWGPAAGTATSPVPVVVPPKPVPSADNTVIHAGSTAAILDAALNKWTINAGGQVAVNGVADTGTSNVTMLAYEKGLVWQENKSNLWWSKTLPTDAWGPAAGTATSPVKVAISVLTSAGQNQTISASAAGTTLNGGDTFTFSGPGVGNVVLGTANETLRFTGMTKVTVSGGSGQVTLTADAGANTFLLGKGAMDVTGGIGADAYVLHNSTGALTIEDFSTAKGDTLTIDASLKSAMKMGSDGHGGTLITFTGATETVDLKGVATLPSTAIHWV